jgi:DNA-binding NarL/FixJ family response regulator
VACSILIVDDSPYVRRSLRTYIEHNTEWRVCDEAENGQIAVEKVKALRPDVVVLDLQMPVMNGLEAARQITSFSPATAMVMFTMYASDELRKEAQAVGIIDVCLKSDEIEDHLLRSLKRICQRVKELGLATATPG